MTFNTQLTTDLSVFFNTDEFAQSVIYAGSAIDALVTFDENLNEAGSAHGNLVIKVSDVPGPNYRDAVVIGSDTWYVRRIIYGDGKVWKVEIYRDERPVW